MKKNKLIIADSLKMILCLKFIISENNSVKMNIIGNNILKLFLCLVF